MERVGESVDHVAQAVAEEVEDRMDAVSMKMEEITVRPKLQNAYFCLIQSIVVIPKSFLNTNVVYTVCVIYMFKPI